MAETQTVTMRMDSDKYREVRRRLIDDNLKFSELVRMMVDEYLAGTFPTKKSAE